MSIWSILVFPALFTAGMSLIDTTDSVLMVGAYGWAFVKPMRKLYYNMTITFVSVVVAVVIGGIEALGLLADKLGLSGGVWDAVGGLNETFRHAWLSDRRRVRAELGRVDRDLSPQGLRPLELRVAMLATSKPLA